MILQSFPLWGPFQDANVNGAAFHTKIGLQFCLGKDSSPVVILLNQLRILPLLQELVVHRHSCQVIIFSITFNVNVCWGIDAFLWSFYVDFRISILGDIMQGNSYQLMILDLNNFLDKIKELPDNFTRIFSNAVAFLIAICFALGVVLAIVGAIKWATGWDDKGGKKTVVKGIVLIAISLIAGGTGITIVTFT